MSIENIVLFGIVLILCVMLFRYSDSSTSKKRKPNQMPNKIRFISEQTGEVIEMNLIDQTKKSLKEFSEETFLANAKIVFQMVTDSFTKGDVGSLKKFLIPELYDVFEKEVLERKEKKHVIDFSLICFDSVKILNKSVNKEEVTVQFVTEQINLLKDADGKVIEGDEMSVATVTDTWTFKRKNKTKWIISATKSGAVYG